MRNTATTMPVVMDQQIAKGRVEVNIGALSRDDIMDLVLKLKDNTTKLKSLRLVCMPKGVVWLQYQYDAHQDSRARQKFIFHQPLHHDVVNETSKHLQNKRVRLRVKEALLKVLLHSNIEELQIGARLAPSGYKAIAEGLARNHTLRRLSFAGSHMGDYALQLMQEGLATNSSLEELDLTACNLTDDGADIVSAVLKRHADKRVDHHFDRLLREYPDTSRDATAARTQYQRALRAANNDLDTLCGGLMHLELAENRITDQGTFRLCTALGYDRRLVLLSLRANALTTAAEREVVELMRDHRALLRVDLRQNPDGKLGILKLRKPRPVPAFNPALGFAKPPLPYPASPTRTEHSAALWELLDTASLAGQSLAGSYIGPVPGSPAAAAEREHRRTPSVVSWGDEQLLSSSPGAHHQRAHPHGPQHGAQQHWSPPQTPLGKSLLSRSSPHGPKVVAQSWSSDAVAPNTSSSGSQPAAGIYRAPHPSPGATNIPVAASAAPAWSSASMGQGPGRGTGAMHASTHRYGEGLYSAYSPGGKRAVPNMLSGLPSSPMTRGIFDEVDKPIGPRRRGSKRPLRVRGRPLRPWHTATASRRPAVRSALRRPTPRYGPAVNGASASPWRAVATKKRTPKKGKKAKAKAAAKRAAAVQAARRASEARAVGESRTLAEAAAAATAQLVQRDMEAVDELALMFRDLEVAVSSLELMYELHRDEPVQFKQYKQHWAQQQQQLQQRQQQQSYRYHSQQVPGGSTVFAPRSAVDATGVGSGMSPSDSVAAVLRAAQLAAADGQSEASASPAQLAQQFRRWRDLCNSALQNAA